MFMIPTMAPGAVRGKGPRLCTIMHKVVLTMCTGARAVSGDTALVGTYNKDGGAHRQQGQTYVFVRAGTTWTQQAILSDVSTGAAGDFFGYSVALQENTAATGAVIKVVGRIDRQGEAYIFAAPARPGHSAPSSWTR